MAKKDDNHDDLPSFSVDTDNLDREWVDQPDLFFKYAKGAADARLKVDEAKQQLDVVAADLDRDIRSRPNHYGLEKITESLVGSTVTVQPTYQEALKHLNRCQHTNAIIQAGVTACDHRKKALENLVYLHGQQYFSSPTARGESSDMVNDATRKKARSKSAMSRQQLEGDE